MYTLHNFVHIFYKINCFPIQNPYFYVRAFNGKAPLRELSESRVLFLLVHRKTNVKNGYRKNLRFTAPVKLKANNFCLATFSYCSLL